MLISWEDRNVKLYSQTELEQAVAQEREACAKLAEQMDYSVVDAGPREEGKTVSGVTTVDKRNRDTPTRIAAAIRARNESV